MLIHLEKNQDFKNLIKEGVTLVDFYATRFGPCKMLAPQLEQLAEKRQDINVIKIDVDQHEELAAEFNIRVVPTLILFKDGANINVSSGFKTAAALENLINTAF